MEQDGTLPAQHLRTRREARLAAWAAVVAGALAGMLTCGVLAGAVLASYNALGDVGRAAHIPDLPVFGLHALAVALDGLAGVALLTLIVLQPIDGLRTYCWLLVGGCIAISMAANGTHAVFDDERGVLTLPVVVAFLISTVPAASAAAALHLVLRIGRQVLDLVRIALRAGTAPERQAAPVPTAPKRPEPVSEPAHPDAEHPDVLAAARSGQGYRPLMDRTGWGRPRAQAALKAARERLGGPAQAVSTEAAA